MKIFKFAILLPLLAGVSASMGCERSPNSQVWLKARFENEQTMLGYLRPVLYSAQMAARINFYGSCYGRATENIPFPSTSVHRPLANASGMAAVQQIYGNDKNVVIYEIGKKIIGIDIGNVPKDILGIKLTYFTLTPMGQYNPNEAIIDMMNLNQMLRATHKLNAHAKQSFTNMIEVRPAAGLPHLPGGFENETFGSVLNLVASTFKGIVVYGDCTYPDGTRLYDAYFTGLEH